MLNNLMVINCLENDAGSWWKIEKSRDTEPTSYDLA